MATDHVWTVAELEALSPDERAAVVRAGFITDPELVPALLLERAQQKAKARIEQAEGSQ
jgi:hypothetical protein